MEKSFEEEKAKATIDKYLRDIRSLYESLPDDKIVDKNRVIHYKMQLTGTYKATSVNSVLTAVNGIFSYLGWTECKVKLLKIQKSSFRNAQQDMSRDDYIKLGGNGESAGKSQTWDDYPDNLWAGIRVSELKYITVEAVKSSRAVINNKGKNQNHSDSSGTAECIADILRGAGNLLGNDFLHTQQETIGQKQYMAEMKNLGKKRHCHGRKSISA